ncbi:MAG: glycosyltransferase [Crocinitomicaceae bacterium]|nr:MAG: glycosyltransferase [Crocinitomicaceae bacterium]
MKKLVIFSPDSVHLVNYLQLIDGYFDSILVITDGQNPSISISLPYPTEKINFSIKNPLRNRRQILHLKKTITNFQPDLIHLHNIGTGAYLLEEAVRDLNVPKVATAWGSDVLVAPKRSFIFRKIVQHVLQNFDAFTCDALFMAYEMEKLSTKPLDIQIANFGVESVDVRRAPKENIIYSNRLHNPLYRIDLIVDLFLEYKSRNPHDTWKLIVAATGSETELLKQKVAQSPFNEFIEFVGWIDAAQNQSWYQKAKIYVSIPRSDGTSISLLEAMAHGCVPIVSNLPANNEWITDGFNGIVYKGKSTLPFDAAMQLDAEKCAQINREIIALHGLKSSNRSKFIAIYDQLLAKK